MTDDLLDAAMDARLRAAGERWRAADDTPGGDASIETVEPLLLAFPPARRRRGATWALAASAAAVVVALVAGAVVLGRSASREPAATGRLAGTVWQASGAWSRTLLVIGADNHLVADDDCALVTAQVRVSGDALTLTNVDQRDKACVEPTLLSRWRLRDGERVGFRIEGGRLALRPASGTAVTFAAAPVGTPAPTTDFPTLTGATWGLTGVTDSGGGQHAVAGSAPLRIDRGTLTASDTCNTLSAKVKRTDTGFTIGEVSTTEIGCVGSTVPGVVDRVLTGRITATLRDNTLTVSKPGVGRLDYVWLPESRSTAGLTGRTWTVASVEGVRARIRASLRFDGNRVTGSDGCRPIDARVTLVPGALTVTGARPTETCSPDASTLASILAQRVTIWRILDGRLVLYGGTAQAFAIVLTTAAPPSPIDGTWRLTTIETGATARQSFDATLAVRDGEAELDEPCLKLRGPVRASSLTVSLADVAAGCSPTIVSISTAGTYTWMITDGQLRLTRGATTLVFAPA